MLTTWLTQKYGLDLPLVSAGMGFVALPPLVAAVSNAGGFGLLACGASPPAVLREMIRTTRRHTTRPFGINLIIETTALGPLTTEEHVRVCMEEQVVAVVFFWAPPPASWIRELRQAQCDVWLQTSSVSTAKAAVSDGVDLIIAQGSEAGGHNRSTTGLFALLPQMVDAVGPVPVVGAGGVADGRGMAAALCLGAAGVCVGTRLVASVEANAHEEYKRRIIQATENDIARTCIFGPEWPDAPMRVIQNRVVREWAGNATQTPLQKYPDPIGTTILGGQQYAMPRFSAILPTVDTSGDFEEMCLPAGDSAPLVSSILTVQEVLRTMREEAENIFSERRATAASS
ncbi:MAG: nitronate monooxygenase [Bryobacteraceae bacterium]|nr:nitronate monooxygenase [Bryobacteraceae bacterium]